MSAESTDRISAVSAASNCSSRALPGLATRAPWQLFAFAGAGACAGELASQPLDLVKTRMQLQGQVCVKTGQRVAPFAYANSGAALVGVLRQEGPRALWAGLPPAILRSLTYGSLRVGLYEPFKGALAMQGLGDASSGGGGVSGAAAAAAGEPSLLLRGTAGALSGGLAAALSTAAGLLLVISTAIAHDLVKRGFSRNITEKQELFTARVAAGVAVFIAGYFGINPPGFVAQVVAFAFGLAASSFFPAIIMGIFSRRMNREGAVTGMIAGITFTAGYIVWFKFLHPELNSAENWWWGISPEGIGVIGMLLNFGIAILISRFTRQPPHSVVEMVERIRFPRGAGKSHELSV